MEEKAGRRKGLQLLNEGLKVRDPRLKKIRGYLGEYHLRAVGEAQPHDALRLDASVAQLPVVVDLLRGKEEAKS